ncbi:MAG: dihydroorotate dehydrogenase electron transfer subunit [Phycisphaerae bacterium]|nr:dihydroorotate dehydrogenase electron transfer subunit [Phycisphaerae bacterium]
MTTNKRGMYVGRVAENRKVCDEHYRLRLALAEFPVARAGQFVQMLCRGLGEPAGGAAGQWAPGEWPALSQPELTDKEPLLRRPLSLAGCRRVADGVELEIIYRTVGVGTSWLGAVGAGTEVSVLGPLGNGFSIPSAESVGQAGRRAALIGGGVGIPPMLFLARTLREAGCEVVAFCGARSARLMPLRVVAGTAPSPAGEPLLCLEEFAELGVKAVVASDDASVGVGGTVTEAFRHYLNAHVPAPDELAVYSCGPEPMMRAAAEICLDRDYACHLALERHMACGMGTCQSCVVKIRDDNERGWNFTLCCTDGPVFDAREILW